MSPACTSTQVFRPKGPELVQFRRYGRQRTKWEGGTVDSERRDTTACRPWAMKKHSQNYSPAGSKPLSVDSIVLFLVVSGTQRLTRSTSVLRGSGFLSSSCFPQFANAGSVVDLGFSLTIKARKSTFFLDIRFSFKPTHSRKPQLA